MAFVITTPADEATGVSATANVTINASTNPAVHHYTWAIATDPDDIDGTMIVEDNWGTALTKTIPQLLYGATPDPGPYAIRVKAMDAGDNVLETAPVINFTTDTRPVPVSAVFDVEALTLVLTLDKQAESADIDGSGFTLDVGGRSYGCSLNGPVAAGTIITIDEFYDQSAGGASDLVSLAGYAGLVGTNGFPVVFTDVAVTLAPGRPVTTLQPKRRMRVFWEINRQAAQVAGLSRGGNNYERVAYIYQSDVIAESAGGYPWLEVDSAGDLTGAGNGPAVADAAGVSTYLTNTLTPRITAVLNTMVPDVNFNGLIVWDLEPGAVPGKSGILPHWIDYRKDGGTPGVANSDQPWSSERHWRDYMNASRSGELTGLTGQDLEDKYRETYTVVAQAIWRKVISLTRTLRPAAMVSDYTMPIYGFYEFRTIDNRKPYFVANNTRMIANAAQLDILLPAIYPLFRAVRAGVTPSAEELSINDFLAFQKPVLDEFARVAQQCGRPWGCQIPATFVASSGTSYYNKRLNNATIWCILQGMHDAGASAAILWGAIANDGDQAANQAEYAAGLAAINPLIRQSTACLGAGAFRVPRYA